MLLLNDIRLPLEEGEKAACYTALHSLGLPLEELRHCTIHKVSVDARRRQPTLVYSVAVDLGDPAREEALAKTAGGKARLVRPAPVEVSPGNAALPGPVVVCGMGPAGLFAALALAKAGFRPLLIERGPALAERLVAVRTYAVGGAFNPEANIQFGEGGAGTFSDGKLTTRIGDPLCAQVTRQLLDAGAPQSIGWQASPHIGTDRLQPVLQNLKEQLLANGGQVRFGVRLEGLCSHNDNLAAIETNEGTISCGVLVLAIGHSARDTFSMLAAHGLPLEPKAFSVGFRIEHLQSEIDKGLYHEAAGHPALPPGEYKLSTKVGGRGVYTFCMCPGGAVVAAASESGTVVTNGMSAHARSGKNANAAVVTDVRPADYGGTPLGGVLFQRAMETAAFEAGGKSGAAPAETLGSFLEGKGRLDFDRVWPSYPRGVVPADLSALLGQQRTAALRTGLREFARKLPGFGAADAVLTAPETRTSSPVRIPRGEGCASHTVQGLYPCGEGAGYAGGIMSAAVDGIRVAHAIIAKYKPE